MGQSAIAYRQGAQSANKDKFAAIAQVVCVYVAIMVLITALRAIGVVGWEIKTLGWSYTGAAVFIIVPAVVLWLTRRRWSDYGVTLADWRTNLSVGMKGFIVSLFPFFIGLGALYASKTTYTSLAGGAFMAATEVVAIVLILLWMRRQKTAASSRVNLILMGLLLLFPIVLGILLGKLTLVVVSTVIWQLVLSGFGEEFAWRGYIQSRLNAAFGRPYQVMGVSFGPGLLIAALFFGFIHAVNTFDAGAGLASLSWGWMLWTTFAGLFFGLIREKTGSLLGCSIAHGLPDAVNEALAKLFDLAF